MSEGRGESRRRLLTFFLGSPLLGGDPLNVFDYASLAEKNLSKAHWAYLSTGSDDDLTVKANRDGFQLFQIRPRRFVEVEKVDTRVEVFGRRYETPVMLAPIGSQRAFHGDAEIATARGARAKSRQMILSTMTSTAVETVAKEYGGALWYQLYPTNEWNATLRLIERAEGAGCPVLVLTADSPVGSNRETALRGGNNTKDAECKVCHQTGPTARMEAHPMFQGFDFTRVRTIYKSFTWEFIDRIRSVTRMKMVVKGVVRGDEAEQCVRHGVEGLVVSNHGGRQEESLLSTIECLPEVVQAVGGKMPVLIDGGFRRGNDVLKAMALGATAVCIGRPYIWGLGADGQRGVESVLDLLQKELVTDMKLAGVPSLRDIPEGMVRRRAALLPKQQVDRG